MSERDSSARPCGRSSGRTPAALLAAICLILAPAAGAAEEPNVRPKAAPPKAARKASSPKPAAAKPPARKRGARKAVPDAVVPAPAPSLAATGPRIPLAEAIRRTLDSAPAVRLARQQVLLRRGLLQQARGRFDSSATFTPSFSRSLGVQTTGAFGQDTAAPDVPHFTSDTETLSLDLRYPMSFRNGVVLTPFATAQGARYDYRGYPGGDAIYSRFDSLVAVRIDAPLGRGAGSTSVAAAERAASLNLDAALETLAQTEAESVRDTVLADWSLAAAQERLDLLERSFAAQRRISLLSEALVNGDEIPRSELDRTRARTADADTAAAGARRALVQARVALAVAMGAPVADLAGTPLAAEALPGAGGAGVPEELRKIPLPDLEAAALRRRADLKAALRSREASDALLAAARIDMRPRFDAALQVGYRGLHEDPALEAASASGVWGSFTGHFAGPSVLVSAKLELPFGNNVYRGRYAQAAAAREQADISARDLERVIRSRALEVSGSVRKAAQEVGAREESVAQNERTISSSYEQFRAGELSLIDTIVTERNQTDASLDLVAARQVLASRLVELAFETGSLLNYVKKEGDVVFGEVSPTHLSLAERP